MQFEANSGQTDRSVDFLSHGPGYTVFLTPSRAVLSLQTASQTTASERRGKAARTRIQTSLSMDLLGTRNQPQGEGQEQLSGTANYFIGNDPSQWHSSIPVYSKVRYTGVYPGIDLVYYGSQQQLEYDFVIAPGSKPRQIRIGFSGVERVEVDEQDGLIVRVGAGSLRWQKPLAYQFTDAGKIEVPARFVISAKNQVCFQVGAYDTTKPLIIDPVLSYATYLGGSGEDVLTGIEADDSGNVYVIGDTSSANYPTSIKAFRTTPVGSNDVVVTKLNATLSTLVYSTYLGGGGNDYSAGIALDSSGNAYLTGVTDSQNFPTRNAAFGANAGFNEAFLSKLGPFGTNLLYSTYLGGGSDDSGNAVAVDNSGNAYIAGDTFSIGTGNTPFPTTQGAYQRNNSGGRDAFVAKFNTLLSGSSSVGYITFLGGNTDEKAEGIAVDGAGNAVVVGEVRDNTTVPPALPSSDFPTFNAFQSTFNRGITDPYTAGYSDGFMTKLNASGNGLIFSTYLGGDFDDCATGVTLDSAGRIFVLGETSSANFPTLNAAQPIIGGGVNNDFPAQDNFVAEFNSNGTSLVYGTFIGGSGYESGFQTFRAGIAVDRFGYIYVAGWTDSLDDFPLTVGADQTNSYGQSDAYFVKINPTVSGPSSFIYSSFLGGDGDDRATACAVDTNGLVYVAGFTSSVTNFPVTPGVVRPNHSGGFYDGWIAKFTPPADLSVAMLAPTNPIIIGTNMTFTIQVNNNGSSSFSGVTNVVQISTNFQLGTITTSKGSFSTSGNQVTFIIGALSNNAAVLQSIAVTPISPGDTINTASVNAIETALLEPNTGNNLSTILETVRGAADVTLTETAPSQVLVTSNLIYTIAITNKGFWPATSLSFSNTLPASLSLLSATVSPTNQGTCFTNGQTVTCDLGTLQKGTGATITLLTVANTIGTAVNVATVSQFELDPVPANNTDSSSTTISPLADLAIAQTASTNQVFDGTTLTYTVFATNKGPSSATGVLISDLLPSGANFVSANPSSGGSVSNNAGFVYGAWSNLASNGIVSLAITVRPNVAGTVTNSASVTSGAADPAAANNTTTLTTLVVPAADLALSENAAPTTVLVSSNVSFTLVLTNRGPSTALGVAVTDPLPAAFSFVSAQSTQGTISQENGVVTCSIASLASGGSATITINTRAVLDGVFANVATVSSSTADLNSNNSASASVTVNENPAAPVLRILQADTNVVLYWSTNAAAFRLQVASVLSTNPAWLDVTNVPAVVGKQFMVTNAISSGNFYRLILTPTSLSASFVPPNHVVVSWPKLGGILKKSSTIFGNTIWTNVGITPVVVGNRYYVTNPVAGTTYFRLFY